MPKKGKSNAEWQEVMRKYARGEFKFGTGSTPGSKAWKAVIKAIDGCPRHHRRSGATDLLGRPLLCKCGYHEQVSTVTSPKAGILAPQIEKAPQNEPPARKQVSTVTSPKAGTLAPPTQKAPQHEPPASKQVSTVTSPKAGTLAPPTQKAPQHEPPASKQVSTVTSPKAGTLATPTQKAPQHEPPASKQVSTVTSPKAGTLAPPTQKAPQHEPPASKQVSTVTSPKAGTLATPTQKAPQHEPPASKQVSTVTSPKAGTLAPPTQKAPQHEPPASKDDFLECGLCYELIKHLDFENHLLIKHASDPSKKKVSTKPSQSSSSKTFQSYIVCPHSNLLKPLLPGLTSSSSLADRTLSSTQEKSLSVRPHSSEPKPSLPDLNSSTLLADRTLSSIPDQSSSVRSHSSVPKPSLPDLTSSLADQTLSPDKSLSVRQHSSVPKPSLPDLTSSSSLEDRTLSSIPDQSSSVRSHSYVPYQHSASVPSSVLPSQFKQILSQSDQEWIPSCLYDHNGKLREYLPDQNWYLPPNPPAVHSSPPVPGDYFRQKFFLWAPMRMWGIPLKCPKCGKKMCHSGIYNRVREVVDVNCRYYLIGADYPKCNSCKVPVCPWSDDILNQLDPGHRYKFPAVLTRFAAMDRKCVTMMKPRTLGNSSSYIQQAFHELHSEEWGRRCIDYLSDCESHRRRQKLTGEAAELYLPPPAFRPLPLAQWFQTAHTAEILGHSREMAAILTSTYGKILKIDSTKKITKKLAGEMKATASWMTNVSNEIGQVLNSVLTVGEGPALNRLCQGIVQRYQEANEPQPRVVYVDRDCCGIEGNTPVSNWFRPWTCQVKLDIFHFMRRLTGCTTTEHHVLFGPFCSRLSDCIFEWDKDDYALLREAKKGELQKMYQGKVPDKAQISAAITSAELARHCRRRTRGVAETRTRIDQLLRGLWNVPDSTGLRLIDHKAMTKTWKVQQGHLPCIQDPDVDLYTRIGTVMKGGKELPVLKCARGSSSLESFHKHQCAFVPGWSANAPHMQMYMLEGGSRWNINRAKEATDLPSTSQTRMYDVRLMSAINTLSQRVLSTDLLPEFQPPGKGTDELIAVNYLLAQSGQGVFQPTEAKSIRNTDDGLDIPLLIPDEPEEEPLDLTISAVRVEDIEEVTDQAPDSLENTLMDMCERCGKRLRTGDMVIHMAKHLVEEEQNQQSPGSPSELPHHYDAPMPSPQETPQTDNLNISRSPVSTHREDPFVSTPQETLQTDDLLWDSPRVSPHQDAPPVLSPPDPDSDNSSPEKKCLDSQGYDGYEDVDNIASFLVDLDTTATALSESDTNTLIELYSKLGRLDKSPTKYTVKSKKERLHGSRWRANRSRAGAIPGVQASERLYMTRGEAAANPEDHRLSNCVCIRLHQKYMMGRNRPKDDKGKTLPIVQSIVWKYSLLKELLADNYLIQKRTCLKLVTVNNTTVSKWLQKRQKRHIEGSLLQGTDLPDLSVARVPLPAAKTKPSHLQEHGHQPLVFEEPENMSGQALKRPYRSKTATLTKPSQEPDRRTGQAQTYWYPPQSPPYPAAGYPPLVPGSPYPVAGYPAPVPGTPYPGAGGPSVLPQGFWPQPYPGFYGWPPYYTPPQATPPPATPTAVPPSQESRKREWRQRKAELEDMERAARGETPKKRLKKSEHYRYVCKECQLQKCAATGHSQVKGKWYCPSFGISVDEWKRNLQLDQQRDLS